MKRLSEWYSGLNIYYKLAPLLFLYLAICIVFAKNLQSDDEGYLAYANRLLSGCISPPFPDIDLWHGPGYPVLLAPFVFFKCPLIVLAFLNGFLLYFSLIICHKTFSMYSTGGSAFIATVLLGLYVPIIRMIPFIMTECLAFFLISLVCFLFLKNCRQKKISWGLIFLTAFSIAYLAMTKVIFGYVILFMLFVSAFLWFFPRFRSTAIKSGMIFLLSFIFCLPWLTYTYRLTHKLFYWTNSGGMSLYTMSTPYSDELGDWNEHFFWKDNPAPQNPDLASNPNHKRFIDSLDNLTSLEKDEAFKTAAIDNIKNHPQKYLSNWSANIGRLLFDFPSSYMQQTMVSYFYIVPNMFILVLSIVSLPISIRHHKILPDGFILLSFFILIYLFGSALVSAYPRMFSITIPFWFFYFSYLFGNIIVIRIK
jgi:4-amino-4-deoxy-L-arabinose transferase-like glycosyltransferase